MSQSRAASLLESVFNIIIGLGVAVMMQRLVFPTEGIHTSMDANLRIAAWFTGASLVRGYVIRRWFNRGLRQSAESLVLRFRALKGVWK